MRINIIVFVMLLPLLSFAGKLHKLVRNNDIFGVTEFLITGPSSAVIFALNETEDGYTPLELATFLKRIEIQQLLTHLGVPSPAARPKTRLPIEKFEESTSSSTELTKSQSIPIEIPRGSKAEDEVDEDDEEGGYGYFSGGENIEDDSPKLSPGRERIFLFEEAALNN